MKKLMGISASQGIAIAKVFELKHIELDIVKQKSEPEKEIVLLNSSIKKSIEEIEKVKAIALKNLGPEEASVFDAHIQVASDPSIKEEVIALITTEKCNAAFALDSISKNYISMFENMEDIYMKERAADLKDVARRVIYNILGIKTQDLTSINEEVIIVAFDLTPSETSQLNKKFVKGFATDIGGKTSHSAIMARSLEIPAVLGLKTITEDVKDGDIVAINGGTGEVFINPTPELLKELSLMQKNIIAEKERLQAFKNLKSVTKDGKHVEIAGNIGSPNDVNGVLENGGDAVGLFRSEFLYMDSEDWPTEEEQYESYSLAIKKMKGKKVIIRTLDIGGDKTLKYFTFPPEMNPFLGYRAIRLCLDKQDIFITQLRAIIRASEFGKLGIMFPMIATVDEFRKAREIYDKVYKDVLKENPKISKEIEVGMMVEIPSAAVHTEVFCKYADFVSIGTNDLMQYSMASDRMNENVSYLYQPLNPSIIKLIKMTIEGAHKAGKWVGMCGEMAGDMTAIPLLVGMGLDEFSMSASSILEAREFISRIDSKKAKEMVEEVVMADNQEQVENILKKYKF
ncbi:MAG: phosphoenolpyruvate--protein phosphotransferase [Mycoplasmataceae bacterium]|nr:phosphoenolpyruvate--protein phosphotransferase [Mycoplasmataceae bacterium]